jgi:hypothetical protein
MVSDEELRSGNILNLLWKFGFPAVVGVVTAGVQEIIDGFFIGNGFRCKKSGSLAKSEKTFTIRKVNHFH